jgi:hypothetical protein
MAEKIIRRPGSQVVEELPAALGEASMAFFIAPSFEIQGEGTCDRTHGAKKTTIAFGATRACLALACE